MTRCCTEHVIDQETGLFHQNRILSNKLCQVFGICARSSEYIMSSLWNVCHVFGIYVRSTEYKSGHWNVLCQVFGLCHVFGIYVRSSDYIQVFGICVFPNHGAWWLSGRFGALHPEGRRFQSHSSHHVGTLGMFFTRSLPLALRVSTPTQYQCRSREHLCVVVDLKRRYRNTLNE